MKRIWFPLLMTSVLLLAASTPGRGSDTVPRKTASVNSPALVEFNRQIAEYGKLRAQADKATPKAKQRDDPADINRHQDALRMKIAAAREGVQEGVLFTPQVSETFRQLLHSELRGTDGKSARLTVMESNPGKFDCRINSAYPANAPVSTVPPELLLKLPQLPEYLEYRFVAHDLILRDTDANMIVDCLRNAI